LRRPVRNRLLHEDLVGRLERSVLSLGRADATDADREPRCRILAASGHRDVGEDLRKRGGHLLRGLIEDGHGDDRDGLARILARPERRAPAAEAMLDSKWRRPERKQDVIEAKRAIPDRDLDLAGEMLLVDR